MSSAKNVVAGGGTHVFSPRGTHMAAAQPGDLAPGASETVIGRGALPFFLAAIAGAQDVVNFQQYKCYSNMCSGNTLNLMMKLGSGDWFPDVPFLLGVMSHFCAFAIFPAPVHPPRPERPRALRCCRLASRVTNGAPRSQLLGMPSSRPLTTRWSSVALPPRSHPSSSACLLP
jgi:hypothetical protein